MKFKKILSLLVVLVVVISAIPSFAADKSQKEQLKEVQSFVKELKVNEGQIKKMMDEEGFSYDEAVHYYTVDKMVKHMQKENMKFDTSDLKVYTDAEIASDTESFKRKIREADLASIMTAMVNAQKQEERVSELKKVVDSYGNNLPSKVTIKYADGSKVEYNASFEETEVVTKPSPKMDDSKLNADTDVLAIEEEIFSTGTFTSYGTYSGKSEIKYYNPIAYTKLRVETNTTYNSSGATVNAVDCFTSTYGTITVSNKGNYATNYSSYSTGTGDVVWAWSGSAGLSLSCTQVVGVSFSVNAGASWTEQLIHRYYDDGDYDKRTKIYH